MAEWLSGFFTAILRSIVVSAILFVATYSLITNEFPPDFSKIKSSWAKLQRLAETQQLIAATNKNSKDDGGSITDSLSSHRRQLEEAFHFDENRTGHSTSAQAKKDNRENASQAGVLVKDARDNAVYVEASPELERRLDKLEKDILFLNQRILAQQQQIEYLLKLVNKSNQPSKSDSRVRSASVFTK